MTKILSIQLSPNATSRYLELAAAQVEAEVNDEVLPCGVEVRVEIAPIPFDSIAYFGEHELGKVIVNLK